MQSIDLRTRLRRDTQQSHRKLDDLVSAHDLSQHEGFSRFLLMQIDALTALAPFCNDAQCAALVLELRASALSDLAHLKTPMTYRPQETISRLHPVALDYVILGSRLGSNILKKRWLKSTDPRVKSADSYFGLPSYMDIWRDFLTKTEKLSGTGPEANQVVSDANRVFDLYTHCNNATSDHRLTAGA